MLGGELRPEGEAESAELVTLCFPETGEQLVFSVALSLLAWTPWRSTLQAAVIASR